ncbi:CCCH zinc finger domain-containing protein [Arthroderma uncinatum]|uniref:CCCH zinc finger domain-containing protein n=1 Tax=Arthroderma uncinatum TaxID=74035 RepID=UPI00144AECDE|nr:CCCH zinc finger domain-containing protein [Arthroderma uncinatum]KAF3479952.1 CCCH zinc finger domain-containing protein [Arthroderma uncinatum]
MRALHYAAVAEGKPQEAIQSANDLFAATEAQIKNIVSNLDAAIKYVIDGENQHPNRLDIVNGKSAAVASALTQQSPFSQPPQGPVQPSPFGAPSASQPSAGLGSAFGKPAMLGQQQPQRPAFGTPSFGQPSGIGQTPALGSSPFGQAVTQTQPQQNPFGQQAASPFAQAAQTTNPFGQPQSQAAAPVQSSPFAQLQTAAQSQPAFGGNPFGSGAPLAQQQAAPTPFGQPSLKAPSSSIQPQVNPLASSGSMPQVKKANPNLNPFPKVAGQTVHDPMTKKLTMWKGLPVQYIENEPCYQHPDDPQSYVHIFFPDGPPKPDTFKYSVAAPEEYTPAVEEAYRYAHEHGAFKDGLLPSAPPKSEWSRYDI